MGVNENNLYNVLFKSSKRMSNLALDENELRNLSLEDRVRKLEDIFKIFYSYPSKNKIYFLKM